MVICRCQYSIKTILADNSVISWLIRYSKLVLDSFSNERLFRYRTQLDIAIDERARRPRWRGWERRGERGQRGWRGCGRRHSLYARCHLHDTSGCPSREFHREHDEDKRGEWRRSDRAARHVSGNIIRHISRVSLSYCSVSVCMLFYDHLLCRIPEGYSMKNLRSLSLWSVIKIRCQKQLLFYYATYIHDILT